MQHEAGGTTCHPDPAAATGDRLIVPDNNSMDLLSKRTPTRSMSTTEAAAPVPQHQGVTVTGLLASPRRGAPASDLSFALNMGQENTDTCLGNTPKRGRGGALCAGLPTDMGTGTSQEEQQQGKLTAQETLLRCGKQAIGHSPALGSPALGNSAAAGHSDWGLCGLRAAIMHC